MNQLVQQDTVRELTPQPQKAFSLTPQTLEEAMKYADMISKSDICPKDFKGNAGNVLVAVQYGAELGIQPLQALQNIAVINGRPCIWGDSLPALAKVHPMFEHIDESFNEQTMTATCKIKRKGEPEQTHTFSQQDANTAKLWNKPGPWQQYPKRMLKMRARTYAIRDVFPDALKGLAVAEEVRDYDEPKDITSQSEIVKKEPLALPEYTDTQFNQNSPNWKRLIESGKKTAVDIIVMISTKYTMTDQQKDRLKNLSKKADTSSEPEPAQTRPVLECDDRGAAYDEGMNKETEQ